MSLEIKLRRARPQTASWIRLTDSGDLELELYDYSGESLGGDVAWTWRVAARDLPVVFNHVPAAATHSQSALLEYLIATHIDVRTIRNWLGSLDIALEETFESQA